MTTPNPVPEDRIRIFNREGFPLAEFRAAIDRSWLIGNEGRAAFSYPYRKTEIVNNDILRPGNWLLVENSALPAWVGVIDLPREWSTSAKTVTITAYTPEHVFGWRRGPLEEKITGSPGTVFEKLLQKVNAAEATVIRAGQIHRGGNQMEETLNPTKLSEDLKRITERSGEEYQWRPGVENGRLVVYADWTDRLGVDTGVILQEGTGGGNIEAIGNILVEDGPIINDLLAYGEGEAWNSRPVQYITNATSRDCYGLRQDSEEYSGVSSPVTLKTNGTLKVLQFKDTAKAFQLNALNVGDTFQYIALGNRFTVMFEHVAFGLQATIRVIGMGYDTDARNKVKLVCQNE